MKKYIFLKDLYSFCKTLWKNKKTMFISISLSIILALFPIFLIKPMYLSKATYEIMLEDLDAKTNVSNFSTNLVNPFSVNQDPRLYKIVEILNSREFLIDFINKYDVRKDLFAVDYYDKETQKLFYTNLVNEDGKWADESTRPDDEAVYELFKVYFSASADLETGFIKISSIHYSQLQSKIWVEQLAYELNEKLRVSDLNQAKKAIDYYELQISNFISQDLIDATSRLLEIELRKKMLANVKEFYAISPIDKPYIPENKDSPSRLFILVFFMMLGFLYGVSKIYFAKIRSTIKSTLTDT
tara:strand:- start:1986 stop:2882 length:897 start_codon:yes stop_codon:yes gene_type:complete